MWVSELGIFGEAEELRAVLASALRCLAKWFGDEVSHRARVMAVELAAGQVLGAVERGPWKASRGQIRMHQR